MCVESKSYRQLPKIEEGDLSCKDLGDGPWIMQCSQTPVSPSCHQMQCPIKTHFTAWTGRVIMAILASSSLWVQGNRGAPPPGFLEGCSAQGSPCSRAWVTTKKDDRNEDLTTELNTYFNLVINFALQPSQ